MTSRKLWIRVICLALALGACSSRTTSLPPSEPTSAPDPTPVPVCRQDTIDALQALHKQLEAPEHLMVKDSRKIGGEFEASEYFTVLKHLSLEPGYVLDWVYCYDGMGGSPVLHVRPEEKPAYETCSAYREANPDSYWGAYAEKIKADGTPESFFELALLRVMGGQFYLFWHSGYNDTRVLCDRESLEATVQRIRDTGYDDQFTNSARRRALRLDPQPVVEFKGDEVSISLLTFTDWGGFIGRTLVARRQYPHEIRDAEREVLVPYDCGIQF